MWQPDSFVLAASPCREFRAGAQHYLPYLTTETAWELTSFLCRNQGAIKFQELRTSIGDKKIWCSYDFFFRVTGALCVLQNLHNCTAHNAHWCMLKRSLMQLGVVPLAACALCGVQNFHKPRSAHAITVSGLSTGVFHQRTCGQREVLPLEIGSEGPHLSRVSVLFFPPSTSSSFNLLG